MVVHQPEKKFQCQTCLKLIRRKISYEKHIKNCKGALITYCLECKKNFRYESFLKTHIVNLHPNLTSNPYYHKLFSSDVK